MTSVGAVGCPAYGPVMGDNAVGTPAQGAIPGLPSPLLDAATPDDVLGMMMAAVERMASLSVDENQEQVRVHQQKLERAIDDFLDKIAASIEAARKAAAERAKEKSRGFFGTIASSVGKVCANVVGSVIDFAKDAVEAPFEIGIALVKNGGNPLQAFQSALVDQFQQLTTDGDVAASVAGFTEGVLEFTADFADFCVACSMDFATGRLDRLDDAAGKLWESLSDHILMNPAFWDVVEPLAKAVTLAGAVASGGALAPIAVGLMLFLEVDSKTGFLERAVGEQAAPYLRMGLALAASSLTLGASGQTATLARYVLGGTTALEGLATVEQGRLDLEQARRIREKSLENIGLQDAQHRVQMLHQLVDELVEALGEAMDTRKTNQMMFQSLAQTQMQVSSAVVFRA